MSSSIEKLLVADYIHWAVPLFLLAIAIEISLTLIRRRNTFRVNDAVTCLAAGAVSELIGIFSVALTSFTYVWAYERWHWLAISTFSLSGKVTAWLALVIVQDLHYYWFHRAQHRINLGWASHVVHHSSEEYNLAVALRQSVLAPLAAVPFYLPIAVVGFPPDWLVSVVGLNLASQFWIHTREIGRLPRWFEAIFNTPSHHRVHHAGSVAFDGRPGRSW